MAEKRHDPDEQISVDAEPEVVLEALLGGAGTADENWAMDPGTPEEET